MGDSIPAQKQKDRWKKGGGANADCPVIKHGFRRWQMGMQTSGNHYTKLLNTASTMPFIALLPPSLACSPHGDAGLVNLTIHQDTKDFQGNSILITSVMDTDERELGD